MTDTNKHYEYEQKLIKKLAEHRHNYCKINDVLILEKIYELFMEDKYDDQYVSNDGLYLNYYAVYQYIKKNLESAEKYFLLAFDKNCVVSMHNLACMCKEQSKFDLAEKYFSIAIDKDCIDSIYGLACVYHQQSKLKLNLGLSPEESLEKSPEEQASCFADKAEKYYLMAIDRDHVKSMHELACLYEQQSKFELA